YLARVFRRIEAAQNDIRARQGRLDGPFGLPAQELHAVGDDRFLAQERRHRGRPHSGPARDQVRLKAPYPFVENLEVSLPPPFAVGKDINTGALLECDGERNGLVARLVPFLPGDASGQVLLEHIEQPGRPRQTTNYRDRKQRKFGEVATHLLLPFTPSPLPLSP